MIEKLQYIEDILHDREWSRLHLNVEKYTKKGQEVGKHSPMRKCQILVDAKT